MTMALNDEEKIKIASEYFVRADQGSPDVLELFNCGCRNLFSKIRLRIGPRVISGNG